MHPFPRPKLAFCSGPDEILDGPKDFLLGPDENLHGPGNFLLGPDNGLRHSPPLMDYI